MAAAGHEEYRDEVDVVVAGGGGAGLSAALFCAMEGLSVVLCETSAMWGGTTATSAGTLWVPGTGVARRAGLKSDRHDARHYLKGELDADEGSPELGMVDAFLDAGPLAIEALEAAGLRFGAPKMHPDYHTTPGAALAGRAIGPMPFDGRLLGSDFASLRPPMSSFMVLGGMMVDKNDIDHLLSAFRRPASFIHATKLVLRHGLSRLRHPRGTRLVMGNALAAALVFAARRHKVRLAAQTRVEDLIVENGRIKAVTLSNLGKSVSIRVRRGVVLATGGFSHDRAMRAELAGDASGKMLSLTFDGARGDGLRLARKVGGRPDAAMRAPSYYMPTSVRAHGSHDEIFPHIFLDRAKPGLIAVNSAGNRFVNEANSYHDFVSALSNCPEHDVERPAHLICDERFLRRYGLGLVHPGAGNWKRFLEDGYLIAASDVVTLAQKLGLDGARLGATIERYNHFAGIGQDPDFGKGSTPLNRFNGDPAVTPNPCLRPIGPGVRYAVAVWPADAGMAIGIRTSRDAQVLSEDGSALGGLYACGNDMASVMRGTYPGPGITLGPAISFAYRAARHLGGRPLD